MGQKYSGKKNTMTYHLKNYLILRTGAAERIKGLSSGANDSMKKLSDLFFQGVKTVLQSSPKMHGFQNESPHLLILLFRQRKFHCICQIREMANACRNLVNFLQQPHGAGAPTVPLPRLFHDLIMNWDKWGSPYEIPRYREMCLETPVLARDGRHECPQGE